MFHLLINLRDIITYAISIYSVLLVIYILMSWVPSLRETGFGRFIGKIVDPYLAFFRSFIPPLGMIDFSPIIAIFALRLISSGIFTLFNIIIKAVIKF